MSEHRWEVCETCGPMVICGNCGNNCCNGGSGDNCPDKCASAYALQKRTSPELAACNARAAKYQRNQILTEVPND